MTDPDRALGPFLSTFSARAIITYYGSVHTYGEVYFSVCLENNLYVHTYIHSNKYIYVCVCINAVTGIFFSLLFLENGRILSSFGLDRDECAEYARSEQGTSQKDHSSYCSIGSTQ